ncbi:hypothetical protein GOZ97_20770 [Agrobacterium vitis]|uniref:hypothetical protein n=2 Tax=Rhizobium/Agrobacterium group TaxID=227290 RepID=UPI001113328A|nr:hypothetical protein [Agrobacterium vitis]MCF1433077.1 hypothetical protein [Allorhizobium ampelinum]MUO92356.1 hypothetical protein [Agrobacterium vitis]MUZ51485.1 hypothetical protein [Agrobacterium vitis]MUZ93866.1 hypothetical protein [Agrobacterium vitis]MVA41160.1 hypothetical protein [Agrobacterium vitis]
MQHSAPIPVSQWNEMKKLEASWFDRLSTVSLTVGVAAPIAASSLSPNGDHKLPLLGFVFWIFLATRRHLMNWLRPPLIPLPGTSPRWGEEVNTTALSLIVRLRETAFAARRRHKDAAGLFSPSGRRWRQPDEGAAKPKNICGVYYAFRTSETIDSFVIVCLFGKTGVHFSLPNW